MKAAGNTALAVLITAVVVGGGMYFWQNKPATTSGLEQSPVVQSEKLDTAKVPLKQNRVVLYTDETYHLLFSTTPVCKGVLAVARVRPVSPTQLVSYPVLVPGSKSWGNSEWFGFNIYSKEEYAKLDPNEPPGTPQIVLTLDKGLLLTRWDAQDAPQDIPKDCGPDSIKVEKQ